MKNPIIKFVSFLTYLLLFQVSAFAQPSPGSIGVGAVFGQPTGVTIKIFNPDSYSFDIMAAWDFDDFLFINVHGLKEKRLGNSDKAHFYYGPGVFVGIREKNERFFGEDNDVALGISGNFGINIMLGQLELFAQLTPRLELVDRTTGDLAGGVGLRFYF